MFLAMLECCDHQVRRSMLRRREDRASGARTERPGLREALSHLRRGDTLVVSKCDRLARMTNQLVGLLEQFEQDGVKLRSLQDGIDPSTTMGKAMLQIGAVFAEMERNLIRERTRAGLAAARARGRLGGRKPKIGREAVDTARRLMKDPDLTMSEIAQRLGVNRVTLYRTLEPGPAFEVVETEFFLELLMRVFAAPPGLDCCGELLEGGIGRQFNA